MTWSQYIGGVLIMYSIIGIVVVINLIMLELKKKD